MRRPRSAATRASLRGGAIGLLRAVVMFLTVLATSSTAARAQQDRLPALGAAREGTTVSGLSSGAYMAVQFQVAFSAEVAGVAAVAGGPCLCAEGSVTITQARCLDMIGPEDVFPRASGSLGHAEALRLVLPFPQAAPLEARNPLGCWDFFAYDDPSYCTRRGRQMRAVRQMLERLRTAAGGGA